MSINRYCCIVLASYLSLWSAEKITFSQANSNTASKSYQDDRIQVAIPANWSSKPVYRISEGSRSSKDVIGVVLSNGPFDLYLLTHYSQASGVKGGRFSEVAQYVVPWLKSDEPESCLNIFQQKLERLPRDLVRVDLILDPKREGQSRDSLCSAIQRKVSRRVWAGAYFGYLRAGREAPGFFINTPLGTDTSSGGNQMVLAASVATTTLGALPVENDPGLRSFLAGVDKIVGGIEYRKAE